MYKILIIEDDLTIAKAISSHLERWDYKVKYLTDFKNVLEQVVAYDPHLILLDIGLPFFNGHYWCSQIRQISKVPIVYLSSMSDNMNIVTAMNMGGDDFITKPFDLTVLTAKVQAVLRRSYAFSGQVQVMEHRGAILNLGDATLKYQEQKLDLTKNEFRILKLLLENSGKVVSREEIMTSLWESDSFIDDNTLTVNVTRLRKRLDEIGLKDFILTKKGLGYLIE